MVAMILRGLAFFCSWSSLGNAECVLGFVRHRTATATIVKSTFLPPLQGNLDSTTLVLERKTTTAGSPRQRHRRLYQSTLPLSFMSTIGAAAYTKARAPGSDRAPFTVRGGGRRQGDVGRPNPSSLRLPSRFSKGTVNYGIFPVPVAMRLQHCTVEYTHSKRGSAHHGGKNVDGARDVFAVLRKLAPTIRSMFKNSATVCNNVMPLGLWHSNISLVFLATACLCP